MSHVTLRATLLLMMVPSLAVAGQADLFEAARNKDVSRLKQILAGGADVNTRDDKGQTPLHVATEEDASDVVAALLAAGALPILTDWRGVGPLAIAVSKKNEQVASLLRGALGPESADSCELRRLRSDSAEGMQRRFLAGHPLRVREALLDALQAMGFVPKENELPKNLAEVRHLEVRRTNPQIAGTGGGAGGERAVLDLEDTTENGRAGVRISMDTKKNLWGGRLRQHSWSVPVLDETECLLAILGDQPLTLNPPIPASSSSGRAASLADGAPVKVRLFRFVHSGEVKEGSQMTFVVIEDVIRDGAVLIRRGAVGKGSITSLEQAASYGRDARLRFQVDSVRAADGQEIRLRNMEQRAGQRAAAATAIAVAQTGLFGLWLKGSEKGIRAGMVTVGYVDGERQVKLVQP